MEQTKRRILIIAFLICILMPGLGHATLNGIVLHPTLFFDLSDLLPVRTFRTPANSMAPTLEKGDYFIAKMERYGDRAPERGDIVIFPFPEDTSKLFVKRVIGLPGERIQIKDKAVFINNRPLNDPWGSHLDKRSLPGDDAPRDNYGPVSIPEGWIFVLGDNRDFSQDSRFWGFVEINEIKGKPLFIYWSDDWNRIGKQIR